MQNNLELDNQQANLIEIGWLVGMIEAEGSIVMTQRKRKGKTVQIQAKIVWSNTDSSIIDKYVSILEKIGIKYYRLSRKKGGSHIGRKIVTQIEVYRFASLELLLSIIIPYLTKTRRQKAEIVMSFIQSRINQLSYNEDGKLTASTLNNNNRRYTIEQNNLYNKFKSL